MQKQSQKVIITKNDTQKDKIIEICEEYILRIGFIIWTPLHLYNAARFIISNDLVGKCDAYYICQSEPMKDYYLSAMDNNFFYNIFFANYDSIKVNQKKWEMISVIISPKFYIEKIFGKDAVGNTYDMLFMSVPTRLNDAIIRANNCKKIVGYDDGTGSYMKDLYSMSLGKKYELAKRIIKIPNNFVADIYLNSPELAPKDSNKNYYKLVKEELNEENVSLLNSLFSFKKEKSISRFIYLNQPIKDIAGDNDYVIKENEIIIILKKVLNTEVSVRMHPREKNSNVYFDMVIDRNEEMWELLCDKIVGDDNVLISLFSTAQFSPKLLFGKEPWLVFTYKLFINYLNSKTIEEMDALVEMIKEKYNNKEKIITCKDSKELERVLSELKKSNNYGKNI